MTDQGPVCWRLFFPRTARYDGADPPACLTAKLRSKPGDGTYRVRVARGEDALNPDDLADYAGVVWLEAAPPTTELRRAGFKYVQRFIALPSLTSLRWLVPAGQGAALVAAQTLPRPYRGLARLQRIALLSLLKRASSLLRLQSVTIASRRRPAVLVALDELFPECELRVSVSAGTPGPMRKPTLACFDREGSALAYAKIATSATAETLLANEAKVLGYISQTPRLRGAAPRLLAYGVIDGRTTLVQSTLAGRAPSKRLGEAHGRLLEKLKSGQAEPVSKSPFVMGLSDRMRAAGPVADYEHLLLDARRALKDVWLPSSLMHGDFAPWNLRQQDGDIRAFDWEYGVIDSLQGLDQLHHVWQTGLLLQKWDVAVALQALDTCARSLSISLDADQAVALVDLYLLHGLLQRLEMGCDERDRLVSSYRAAMRLRPVAREVGV